MKLQLSIAALAVSLLAVPAATRAQDLSRLAPAVLPEAERPFGTLQQQAAMQHEWLKKRLDTFLPALMRTHRIDMWVVPMREYNEDPVFTSLVSPTTFAARRRTIYVFFDPCANGRKSTNCDIERIALGGTSQGGVYRAVRSTKAAAGPAGGKAQYQAELWGDEQWSVVKQ